MYARAKYGGKLAPEAELPEDEVEPETLML